MSTLLIVESPGKIKKIHHTLVKPVRSESQSFYLPPFSCVSQTYCIESVMRYPSSRPRTLASLTTHRPVTAAPKPPPRRRPPRWLVS